MRPLSLNPLNLPKLGMAWPRRGNAFSRACGRVMLHSGRWRFEGDAPELNKCVMVGAPHTSNWDAFYGLAIILALGWHCHWMAKAAVFKGPFKKLLVWLGGISVDRGARHGVVEQIVAEFKKRDKFFLALTPEGTRRRVDRWKTGFYYIALQANVPILAAYIDYERRTMGFGPMFYPSGDVRRDMEKLEIFYQDKKGKRVENFNPSICGNEEHEKAGTD